MLKLNLFCLTVLFNTCFFLPLTTTKVYRLPLVINTWAFQEANAAAWSVLSQKPGGSALDALVEGCSTCERLQCDGTVGFGGSPDENGETTLDAMIMDGATMNIGAVANLRQIKNAARVARYVLEHTRHTLLVGDAASSFAEMMGFKRESLTTNVSNAMWLKWRANNCQPNFWLNTYPDATKSCGPYQPLTFGKSGHQNAKRQQILDERYAYNFGPYNHDTIGMIVIDADGKIYAGTSTNGARHKIPGRVGDSPIPGAGAYADNEIGAAAATGDGDIMMRFLPAFAAVEALRSGLAPTDAAMVVMTRIVRHHANFVGGLIVANNLGNYGAACVGMDKFPFSVSNGSANKTAQETRVEYTNCIEVLHVDKK